METFNRGTLRKLILAGKVSCVGGRSYDDMHGESVISKEMPVQIGEYKDYKEGTLTIYESDLKSKSGMAYKPNKEKPDWVCLIIHGNLSYELRITP